MTTAPIQLEYGRARRWDRRRVVRTAVRVTALISLITAAAFAAPKGWRHAKLLHYQEQCLDYVAPAGQVVFDTQAADSIKYGHPLGLQSGAPPLPYKQVGACGQQVTEWTRLAALSQQTGFADATAFLHARRADQHSEVRLVVVEVSYVPTMCFGPKAMFEARVFDPAAGLGKLKEMNATGNKWLHDVQSFYEPGERVKILGGRPDPADSAHFTIEYLREPGSPNERAGTIDGWLTSDDRVVLEIRGKSLHRRDRRAVR